MKLTEVFTNNKSHLNESYDDPYELTAYHGSDEVIIRFQMRDIKIPRSSISDLYYDMRDRLKDVLTKEDVQWISEKYWDFKEQMDDTVKNGSIKQDLDKIAEIFVTLLNAKASEYVMDQENKTKEFISRLETEIRKRHQ